jgi:hypothetical protein
MPIEKTGNDFQRKNWKYYPKEKAGNIFQRKRKNRQLNLHLHTRERRST